MPKMDSTSVAGHKAKFDTREMSLNARCVRQALLPDSQALHLGKQMLLQWPAGNALGQLLGGVGGSGDGFRLRGRGRERLYLSRQPRNGWRLEKERCWRIAVYGGAHFGHDHAHLRNPPDSDRTQPGKMFQPLILALAPKWSAPWRTAQLSHCCLWRRKFWSSPCQPA